MSLTLNTNIASLTAQRNLQSSQSALQKSIEKLSSGFRINSAADDAAGLAIATRMDSQIRGMTVASRNANDALSLTQTASSAMGDATNILQRMRELAVQSSNATNSTNDQTALDTEFGELAKEVQRTLGGTQFNGLNILGSNAGSLSFQVGAGTTTNDTIAVTTTDLTQDATVTAVAGTDNAGTGRAKIDGSTTISTVIDNIDKALTTLNGQQATMGAVQNRFNNVISNLANSITNQQAAKSRIMDVDFAAETANMAKHSVLQQAGTSVLAQANQLPNSILTLLR